MSLTLLASTVVALSSLGAGEYLEPIGRDAILITPAPYPAGRTDSVHRLENGRLWHSRYPIGSRTPIPEQIYADRGAAWYGAPPAAEDEVIFVRNNTQVIALRPWSPLQEDGFDGWEIARNRWLREQGYVLTVRTHVNPRYQHAERSMYPSPRATIELHDELPRRPYLQRVDATPRPVSSQPVTRISTPDWARHPAVEVADAD